MFDRDAKEYITERSEEVEGGCWEWVLTGVKGYGRARFKGARYMAHRLSWMAYFGEIPNGMKVCHKCDNPLCVNPSHLFVGTQKQNIQDAKKKGRVARNSGEKCGRSKITESQAYQILRSSDIAPVIAEKLGVSVHTVHQVRTRKTWRHLDCEKIEYPDGRSIRDKPKANEKLNKDIVNIAKEQYRSGVTQTEIAKRLGVHSSTISRAVRGERWRPSLTPEAVEDMAGVMVND